MNSYSDWAAAYPEAAAALIDVLQAVSQTDTGGKPGGSEASAQQQVRMDVAKQGGFAWRNNVGATPSKCKHCGEPSAPVRYGLANDSHKLNSHIKSSDLILAIPRKIQPEDVGRVIAQFGAVETKRPGWVYTGVKQEPAQAAWLALINRIGGFAAFSTGSIEL